MTSTQEDIDLEGHISWLGGYVSALALVDSPEGAVVASAFIADLQGDLVAALETLYEGFTASLQQTWADAEPGVYAFGCVQDLNLRQLQDQFEGMFLQSCGKAHRYEAAWRIVDMIGIAGGLEHSAVKRVEMRRTVGSETYAGWMVVAPLARGSLLISCMSAPPFVP